MFGFERKKSEIYADHASGSPISPRVKEEMSDWLGASWNPSAIHPKGVMARTAIEDARASIAKLLYAHADEITFTASATEAIHLVVHSAIASFSGVGVPHVITTPIEHHAVLEQLRVLEKQKKITLDYLTLLRSGAIDPHSLTSLINPSTALVMVMYANTETGVIQPIRAITKIVRDYKKADDTRTFPYVLTDACQTFLSLEHHVERLGVDYLILNSAKVGGPQGSALLYARRNAPLLPVWLGGGQEGGRRAGTENVAGIIGFAKALDIAQWERKGYEEKVSMLRDALQKNILATFPDAYVNGSGERLPGHLNMTFGGADHQYLALALGQQGIMVGTRSACRENDDGDSHILTELRKAGDAPELPAQAIRFSLGKENTKQDVEAILKALKKSVPLARASKSAWYTGGIGV